MICFAANLIPAIKNQMFHQCEWLGWVSIAATRLSSLAITNLAFKINYFEAKMLFNIKYPSISFGLKILKIKLSLIFSLK